MACSMTQTAKLRANCSDGLRLWRATILDLRVFGSRARGDAAPDSDLDVFVESEQATPELRQRISEIAWEVGFERDRVICTRVATREELEHAAVGAILPVINMDQEGVGP